MQETETLNVGAIFLIKDITSLWTKVFNRRSLYFINISTLINPLLNSAAFMRRGAKILILI